MKNILDNNLSNRKPYLAAQWHPTLNGSLVPDEVAVFSNKRAWWRDTCGHEYEAAISERSKGMNCRYCCQNPKVLKGFNDLQTKNPELAQEWNSFKNGKLKPDGVTVSSSKKVWWLGKCGHEWLSTVANRTSGTGCTICLNQTILKGFNDLSTTKPELTKEWHPIKNSKLSPDSVSAGSGKTAWWLGTCGHEWEMQIVRRVSGENCPYCANRRILLGFNDLASKNPELTKEWHPTKNNITPFCVFEFSHFNVWWLGKCGHEWEATIANRNVHNSGCPACCLSHSKLEKTIENKLGIEKFDKLSLFGSQIKYRPDFKLSETLFLNSDGLYWHSSECKDKNYHFDMRKSYQVENKRILQFYQDEIYNKWPIIESIINNALGKITNKIQARKCIMREISPKESSQFFGANHLMGSHKASKSIGLYFNNELVSALSYRLLKKKNKVEISRFGSKINTVVIGAFGKLLSKLKEIAKLNNITQIESFCDLRYATGSSYEKMGFVMESESLGWCWTNGKSRFNRLMCKASPGKSEKENAQEKGWFRIYDAGQRKYILTI